MAAGVYIDKAKVCVSRLKQASAVPIGRREMRSPFSVPVVTLI